MNLDFTITSDDGYLFQPFTNGHDVGYLVTAPNGVRWVVYLSPWQSTDNGRALTTVHHGRVDADLAEISRGGGRIFEPAAHYIDLCDVDTTADLLARRDMETMAIGDEPLPEEIRLRAADYAESLNAEKGLSPEAVRMRGSYGGVGGADFLDLDRICDWLHLYGVKAYVEQTGGGCATIYVGEQMINRYGDGDLYYPVAMGPGWFEGPSWTEPHAVVGDFYIGPHDQGDAEPVTPSEATTELECAWIAIHVLRGEDPFEEDANGDRVVRKATPVGPAITA